MLAESARVLIADELAGLDVQARKLVFDFLRREGERRHVMIITHNPLDIQELRGGIAVMLDGRIAAVYEDYEEALARVSERRHLIRVTYRGEACKLRAALERYALEYAVEWRGGTAIVEALVEEEALQSLERELTDSGMILSVTDDSITPILRALSGG